MNTQKMLVITAVVGTIAWLALLAGLSRAATAPNPGWRGYSMTGCTVDNPHAYPDTQNAMPGGATYMRGIIKTYQGKMNYGTIEAWADDYPEITYTCYYLDNKQPFPESAHGWVWVTWGDDAKYADYTIAPVAFTPYYYPPATPGSTTLGGTIPPCNGQLNYAQQQTFNSRACLQESLNQQQGGWTFYESWSGECFANFGLYQKNPIGQNCIQHFGCASVLVCPDGNWTCGNNCNSI